MSSNFKKHLLQVTKSSACEEMEVIQSLWSGYGTISRFQLSDSARSTVVVKHIELKERKKHPRGWNTDVGHNRKVKSYEVETLWYEKWSQACTNDSKIPEFIASYAEGQNQWIVLEDLIEDFPLLKQELSLSEVKVCLQWLANFHATFLNQKPKGLWEVGTYWHLETRPDEWAKIENKDLKAQAARIDNILNNCQYQTIVHGDAKLANFCFSEDGKQVAAVDFQYVGGGCGMKDVAYFLGSCLSSNECEMYEKELLEYYFSELKKALEFTSHNINFEELEKEWRNLYPIAVTDFARFLLAWMPGHQKLNKYSLDIVGEVLARINQTQK